MPLQKKNIEREKNKMTNITSMKNIGKEMANKLISVGIETKEKLMEIGSK